MDGKGFILQGDLNSWLGNKIIPIDPRKQNENGKLMEAFLLRNHLAVVNSHICVRECLQKYKNIRAFVKKE